MIVFIYRVNFLLDHLRQDDYIVTVLRWPGGRVVMQRTANPCTSVRFRSRPPAKVMQKSNAVKFLPF